MSPEYESAVEIRVGLAQVADELKEVRLVLSAIQKEIAFTRARLADKLRPRCLLLHTAGEGWPLAVPVLALAALTMAPGQNGTRLHLTNDRAVTVRELMHDLVEEIQQAEEGRDE